MNQNGLNDQGLSNDVNKKLSEAKNTPAPTTRVKRFTTQGTQVRVYLKPYPSQSLHHGNPGSTPVTMSQKSKEMGSTPGKD